MAAVNNVATMRSRASGDTSRAGFGFASNSLRAATSSRLNVTVTLFSFILARYLACRSAPDSALPVLGRPRGRLVGSMSVVW